MCRIAVALVICPVKFFDGKACAKLHTYIKTTRICPAAILLGGQTGKCGFIQPTLVSADRVPIRPMHKRCASCKQQANEPVDLNELLTEIRVADLLIAPIVQHNPPQVANPEEEQLIQPGAGNLGGGAFEAAMYVG